MDEDQFNDKGLQVTLKNVTKVHATCNAHSGNPVTFRSFHQVYVISPVFFFRSVCFVFVVVVVVVVVAFLFLFIFFFTKTLLILNVHQQYALLSY